MLTPEQIQQIRGRIGIQPQESNRASELEAAWSQTPETSTEKPGLLSRYDAWTKRTGQTIGKGGAAVLGALTSSERALGHTIGETAAAIGGNSAAETLSRLALGGIPAVVSHRNDDRKSTIESATQNKINEADMQMRVQRRIAEKKKLGEDTSDLEWALMRAQQGPTVEEQITEATPSVRKTTGQVVGELGGTALDALSFGTYGAAAKGMQAGKLASKTPSTLSLAGKILPKAQTPLEIMKQAGKASLVGGGVGYGYDVTTNLKEGKEGADAAMPGMGTFIGATVPLAAGIISGGKRKFRPSPEGDLADLRAGLDDAFKGKQATRDFVEKAIKRGDNPVDFLTQKAGSGDQVPIDVVDGFYKTQEGQNKLWSDVRYLSTELTEGLKAQPERLSLNQLEKEVLESLPKNSKILEAQRKVRQEFRGLRAAYSSYGDSIPLDIANEIKSDQWKQMRTTFAKMQPDYVGSTNFQIGETLKNAIEKALPDSEVAELNKVIGQHLSAIELLAKLDNTVAKNGKLGKHFFRIIGAIAGSHGGPAGTLLGAGMGDWTAQISQRIPSSSRFKNSLLAKGGSSTPQVIKQWAEYLARKAAARASEEAAEAAVRASEEAAEAAARASRLALPSGITETVKDIKAPIKTTIKGKGVVSMGPEADKSGVEVIPAQKGPIGVDPKTGRFIKTYSSDPNSVGGTKAGGLNNPQANTPANTSASSVIADSVPQNPDLGNDVQIFRGQSEAPFSLDANRSKVNRMKGTSFSTEKGVADTYTLSGRGKTPTIIEGSIPKSKILTIDDLSPEWQQKLKNEVAQMTEDDIAEGSLPENVIDDLIPYVKSLGKEAIDMDSLGLSLTKEIRVLDDSKSFKQTGSSAGTPYKKSVDTPSKNLENNSVDKYGTYITPQRHLADPVEGSIYYHGVTKEDKQSLLKEGFNPSLSKKGFAEQPEAFYVGDHSEASMYNDDIVGVRVKKGEKVKTLDVSSTEWRETIGRSTSKAETTAALQEVRKRGYDAVNAGDEIEILNPSKFEIFDVKKDKSLYEQVTGKKPEDFKGGENLVELAKKSKNLDAFMSDAIKDKTSNTFDNLRSLIIERDASEFVDASKNAISDQAAKEKIIAGQLTNPKAVAAWKDRISKGERPPVFLNDIASTPYKAGVTLVDDGHHRLEAYRQLGIEKIPTISKSQLTNIWNKANRSTSGGKTTLGTVIGGALATGALAGLNPRELEYVKVVRNDENEAPRVNSKSLKDAIAFNETNSLKGDKYSFSKPSGIKEYGNDNGKYQITDAELKSYSKRFLGHNVTPKEFLASPTLQELYMDGKIKWLSENYGWGPEEILASHRGGLSKPDEIEDLKKKKENYIKNAMSVYNSNI